MLEGPRLRKRKMKRWDRSGDENSEKGTRRMQKTEVDVCRSMTVVTRHMHDGKVAFIQGEMVEYGKPMGRLSRLTDAELTIQVKNWLLRTARQEMTS